VIPWIESVTADRILDDIWDMVSVMRMRDWRSGEDFDILDVGSFRERILLEGAVRYDLTNALHTTVEARTYC